MRAVLINSRCKKSPNSRHCDHMYTYTSENFRKKYAKRWIYHCCWCGRPITFVLGGKNTDHGKFYV